MKELTKGRGVDIAIEAVGKPSTWQMAVSMFRRGGTVNFFGGCPNESHVSLWTRRCCTIRRSPARRASTTRRCTSAKALEAVARGDITARDFVNREEPLTNLLEVMRHLMSHNGHMKTAIIP